MKNIFIILGLVLLAGCKQMSQPKQDKEPKQPDTRPIIETAGCSVSKTRGVISVTCADGSSASTGIPALHVKDANGTILDGIIYLGTFSYSTPVILNTVSGNVLSYDNAGVITKISRVFFDGPSCTGNIFAFPPDQVLKNKVYLNNLAHPEDPEAFRIIGFISGNTNIESQYQAGSCSNFINSTPGLSKLELTDFDSSDPLTIIQPLEIVSDQ